MSSSAALVGAKHPESTRHEAHLFASSPRIAISQKVTIPAIPYLFLSSTSTTSSAKTRFLRLTC